MLMIAACVGAIGVITFIASALHGRRDSGRCRIHFTMSYGSKGTISSNRIVTEKKAGELVIRHLKVQGLYEKASFSSSLTDMSGNWVPFKY